MSYVKVNVPKPGQNLGIGGDKEAEIIFFDWDDVLNYPGRDSKGILITGNIVFKENAYMITIYGTQHTIKNTAGTEGDPDSKGVIQGVEFSHPGSKLEIREFRTNWMNRNVGIIVKKPEAGIKELFGSPGAPLQLQFSSTDDKDNNNTVFTFKSSQKGPDVAIYEGSETYAAVKGTVAADATVVNVAAGEGEYQLTTGSAAPVGILNLTNPVDNGIYTLLGSGGANPSTIAAGGNFILKDGTEWTALANSRITFKAIKDGAASFKFVEQSRD